MIQEIILTAIIISLYTTGVFIASDDNMILNPFKNWFDKFTSHENSEKEIVHYKIFNPVIGCPYCMPSLHGLYIFFFLHFQDVNFVSCETLITYIISFTCATGLNAITISHYNK